MDAREELVDFLVGHISPEVFSSFQPSEQARQRVWHLIEKEKETGLLPEEKLELDDFLKLEHILLLAKAKAQLAARNA